MKVRVGIEGFSIDSAHYTLSSPKDNQLHGHTYRVTVEVEEKFTRRMVLLWISTS